jgi:predicted amidophosphoribosyltransferase
LHWKNLSLQTLISHEKKSLFIYSFNYYSPVAQKILLAAKESNIKSADYLLIDALTESAERFLRENWIDALVSIPSRQSISRKRGRQFVATLTNACSKNLDIPHFAPLAHSRKVRDQSGLDIQGRRNNLAGALVAEIRDGVRPPARVLLIDDLVTTGATLFEAARALEYAGIEVIGGVTACVAKPLR